MFVSLCGCVCVCACVRACVRVCVRPYVRARMRVCDQFILIEQSMLYQSA